MKSFVVVEAEIRPFFYDIAESEQHLEEIVGKCVSLIADKITGLLYVWESGGSGQAIFGHAGGFRCALDDEDKEIVNRALREAIEETRDAEKL